MMPPWQILVVQRVLKFKKRTQLSLRTDRSKGLDIEKRVAQIKSFPVIETTSLIEKLQERLAKALVRKGSYQSRCGHRDRDE